MTDTDLDPALKDRLHDTWSAGDYGRIAEGLRDSAESFWADLGVVTGARVLDVACGTGQIAIPAARAGCVATGLDLCEPWIAQARARAAAEGLDVRFDVGDAEALPYGDGAFDVTVSLIGAMFAPRPERVAAEMARVTRPGGRIVMGNWMAGGFVGAMFRTVSAHVPPPDMPAPLLWGDPATARARFEPHVSEVATREIAYRIAYDMAPDAVVAHYASCFGPVVGAMAALDGPGRTALAGDLERLWREHDRAGTPGRVAVESPLLVVEAVR